MPKEIEPTGEEDWAPPVEVQRELEPYLDVAHVGPIGFWAWITGLLPLLPRPSKDAPTASRAGGEERIHELARQLASLAEQYARLRFLASEYFRDNAQLSRRVRALEAMGRTRGAKEVFATGKEERGTTERYLPSGPREGDR